MNMKQDATEELLTVAEVANKISLSEARVYELIRRGLLPCVRFGRQIRISKQHLLDFINSGGKGL